jgi:hypothetical protein
MRERGKVAAYWTLGYDIFFDSTGNSRQAACHSPKEALSRNCGNPLKSAIPVLALVIWFTHPVHWTY